MFRILTVGLLLTVALSIMSCRQSRSFAPQQSPILASDARISHIRTQLAAGSPHHVQALAALQKRVLAEDLDSFERTETNWNYARSYLAQSAAFLYRLTGEQSYADIAYRTLAAVYEDPDPDQRLPESGEHGLSRATVGLGFALAYAWCAEAWNTEQRQFVRDALHRSLAMWKEFQHSNFRSARGSNWVSVCRGSELVQILALNEHHQRRERYDYLIQELTYHISNAFDSIGATQEGVGYTDYGSVFLLPAVLASRDAGDNRLFYLLRDRDIQLQRKAAYAHAVGVAPKESHLAGRNLTLFSGVGGLGAGNQGWASLLLAVTPEQELPYVRWWYDRTFGVLRPAQGGHLPGIEPKRQGAIWSLLFYPEVAARNPEGQWPLMIYGDQGRHYIRQRWRNERDIMLNIHAQMSYHSQAWSMVELGQWSLIAYGRMLVGGPRRERSGEQHSMLLVDGERASRRNFGSIVHRHHDEHTASVVIDGGDYYRALGLESYQRHLLTHFFAADENRAVLAMYDAIAADDQHHYQWGLPIVDEGLEISIANQGEFPRLVISSPDGGQLTAWLVSPQGAEWVQAPGRVSFDHHAADAELLVVMSLRDDGPGELQQIVNDERKRHLRVDGIDLIHDRQIDRLILKGTSQE